MVGGEDYGKYYLKLQIYRKKLRLAVIGLIIWLFFSIAILLMFRPPVYAPLLAFIILICLPAISLSGTSKTLFVEPSEWAIPILLPYYLWRIKRIEKSLEKT